MLVIATSPPSSRRQALISGAFSLTRGAIQLGYFPRIRVVHTSRRDRGRSTSPGQLLLLVACVALVVGFQSSGSLAAAYGIAVTGTMAITSVLFYGVARERLGLEPAVRRTAGARFLVLDLAFLGANVTKIGHGGWFPLAVGPAVFILITTWRRGRVIWPHSSPARAVRSRRSWTTSPRTARTGSMAPPSS